MEDQNWLADAIWGETEDSSRFYLSEEERSERRQRLLSIERSDEVEAAIVQDEAPQQPDPADTPQKKRLKRELEQVALTRLEESARTEKEFRNVVSWWDRLDANRERKERYHELSRNGDDVPLDYGAKADGIYFPSTLNGVTERLVRQGDFLDVFFACPYELHELAPEDYQCEILRDLSDDHREIFFFHGIQLLSTKQLGAIRGQSDRNIRKVYSTIRRQIHRKSGPYLLKREALGISMTKEERQVLEEYKKAASEKKQRRRRKKEESDAQAV